MSDGEMRLEKRDYHEKKNRMPILTITNTTL